MQAVTPQTTPACSQLHDDRQFQTCSRVYPTSLAPLLREPRPVACPFCRGSAQPFGHPCWVPPFRHLSWSRLVTNPCIIGPGQRYAELVAVVKAADDIGRNSGKRELKWIKKRRRRGPAVPHVGNRYASLNKGSTISISTATPSICRRSYAAKLEAT